MTFEALRGDVDLSGVEEVSAPVLYSRLPPDEMVSAAQEDSASDSYSRLDGKTVTYQVRIADTGAVATVAVDAGRALRELDARRDTMRRLLECIG